MKFYQNMLLVFLFSFSFCIKITLSESVIDGFCHPKCFENCLPSCTCCHKELDNSERRNQIRRKHLEAVLKEQNLEVGFVCHSYCKKRCLPSCRFKCCEGQNVSMDNDENSVLLEKGFDLTKLLKSLQQTQTEYRKFKTFIVNVNNASLGKNNTKETADASELLSSEKDIEEDPEGNIPGAVHFNDTSKSDKLLIEHKSSQEKGDNGDYIHDTHQTIHNGDETDVAKFIGNISIEETRKGKEDNHDITIGKVETNAQNEKINDENKKLMDENKRINEGNEVMDISKNIENDGKSIKDASIVKETSGIKETGGMSITSKDTPKGNISIRNAGKLTDNIREESSNKIQNTGKSITSESNKEQNNADINHEADDRYLMKVSQGNDIIVTYDRENSRDFEESKKLVKNEGLADSKGTYFNLPLDVKKPTTSNKNKKIRIKKKKWRKPSKLKKKISSLAKGKKSKTDKRKNTKWKKRRRNGKIINKEINNGLVIEVNNVTSHQKDERDIQKSLYKSNTGAHTDDGDKKNNSNGGDKAGFEGKENISDDISDGKIPNDDEIQFDSAILNDGGNINDGYKQNDGGNINDGDKQSDGVNINEGDKQNYGYRLNNDGLQTDKILKDELNKNEIEFETQNKITQLESKIKNQRTLQEIENLQTKIQENIEYDKKKTHLFNDGSTSNIKIEVFSPRYKGGHELLTNVPNSDKSHFEKKQSLNSEYQENDTSPPKYEGDQAKTIFNSDSPLLSDEGSGLTFEDSNSDKSSLSVLNDDNGASLASSQNKISSNMFKDGDGYLSMFKKEKDLSTKFTEGLKESPAAATKGAEVVNNDHSETPMNEESHYTEKMMDTIEKTADLMVNKATTTDWVNKDDHKAPSMFNEFKELSKQQEEKVKKKLEQIDLDHRKPGKELKEQYKSIKNKKENRKKETKTKHHQKHYLTSNAQSNILDSNLSSGSISLGKSQHHKHSSSFCETTCSKVCHPYCPVHCCKIPIQVIHRDLHFKTKIHPTSITQVPAPTSSQIKVPLLLSNNIESITNELKSNSSKLSESTLTDTRNRIQSLIVLLQETALNLQHNNPAGPNACHIGCKSNCLPSCHFECC